MLDGFHKPVNSDPLSTSGKGGGFITYINRHGCELENIMEFEQKIKATNSGEEFQLIKIQNCNGLDSTNIVGNIYRSPSENSDFFVNFFDNVFCSLDRLSSLTQAHTLNWQNRKVHMKNERNPRPWILYNGVTMLRANKVYFIYLLPLRSWKKIYI